MSKNLKLAISFLRYCLDNPDQRFWQALRNWSGYLQIWGVIPDGENIPKPPKGAKNTFYLNTKK